MKQLYASMNTAIVDDAGTDRLLLEEILKEYAVLNCLSLHVDHYESGEEFLAVYQPFRYTVVFLDIFMKGISGIETAEKIRENDEDSPLVFLTTSEVHRPDAFSVFAAAYLSKPTEKKEVFRVLDHILRLRTENDRCFCFSYDRRQYCLTYAEIVSVETDGNYLIITDRQGQKYRTRMTFSRAQTQLDSRFLILIKGILVNMDYIEQIRDKMCLMKGGMFFPIHIKKEKELKQKWLNYKFASIRSSSAAGTGEVQC